MMRLKGFFTVIIILLFALQLKAQKADFLKDSTQNVLLVNGLKEYNNQNYSQAKKYFSELIKNNPKNDAGYYYLANIALKEDDISSGELYLKKSLSIDSSNFWYWDLLGKVYMQNKEYNKGIDVYNKLLERYPKKNKVYFNLLECYIFKNDLPNAKQTLKKIETIWGKSENTALMYMNICSRENNWDAAFKYLIEFDKEIQSPKIESIIGDMYADRLDDSTALFYYNKALSIDKDFTPALYSKAEIYRMKGDFKQYFENIQPYISNPKIDAQGKVEYIKQVLQTSSILKTHTAQMDTMILDLEKANPTDTNAIIFSVAYNAIRENQEKVFSLLEKNCSLYPDNKKFKFDYLYYLFNLKKWDKFFEKADVFLKEDPQNVDYLQMIGFAHAQNSDFQKSIETFNKLEKIALSSKDTNLIAPIYSVLGDVYHESGNPKMAYSYYKKALKINPKDNAVLNNYAYYLALEGKNLKQAYQMSKQTIESEPDNPTYLDTFGWILFLMDKPVEAKAQFKHAMLYGGKESAAILDHYADVLFALKEYDLAFIYWDQAKALDSTLNIDKKIKERKKQIK